MKKFFALLMILAMVFSLAACSINRDGEVSVLWSDLGDDYLATIADALDRAMYIENIAYSHYDAEGDAAKQIQQAKDAVAGGAVALVASAADVDSATEILGIAKDAGIPLVFLCCGVDLPATLLSTYDKCVAVNVDYTSLYTTLGEKIAEDLIENYDDYDRNDDGKISYAAFGLAAAAVPTINEELRDEEKAELVADSLHTALSTEDVTAAIDSIFEGYDGSGNKVNETPVELIIADDDAYVEELLLAMRKYELNHEKLVTHFIPLYTVGIAENAGGLIESDEEEELAAYSVMSAIDSGYLSAAALENDDELALSTAKILRNFIKGDETLDDVKDDYIREDGMILVPYTIYGA